MLFSFLFREWEECPKIIGSWYNYAHELVSQSLYNRSQINLIDSSPFVRLGFILTADYHTQNSYDK
jgi:hypothetical protein